jgi:hypothetical protein
MKKQFTIACILVAITTIQAKAQDNKLLLNNHQYSGAVAKKKRIKPFISWTAMIQKQLKKQSVILTMS